MFANSNPQNTHFLLRLMPVLLSFGFLLGPIHSFAEDRDCFGLSDPTCGGPNIAGIDKCYPQVDHLSVSVVSIDASRNVVFRASVSGTGFKQSGTLFFKIVVFSKVGADGAESFRDGCSTNLLSVDNQCVDCSDNCITWTENVPIDSTIRIWAVAGQKGGLGSDVCGCTSDTISMFVTGPSGPVTLGVPLASELGPIACDVQVGDPINATNGNMYLKRSDAIITSDLGLPIELDRNYNSFTNDSTSSLSRNWRHSLEYELASDTITGDLILTEATGREVRFKFTRLINNTPLSPIVRYSPPMAVFYELDIDSAGTMYTITRQDDTKLMFDSLGPIDFMEDRGGNRNTLYYSGSRLDSVSNPEGRSLEFHYTNDLLSQVSAANESTLVQYEYYPVTDLLKKVTYPDSTWEQYDYGANNFDNTKIVAATNSDGVVLNYAYDSSGLANTVFLSDTLNSDSLNLFNLTWDSTTSSSCLDTIKLIVVATGDTSIAPTTYESVWLTDGSARVVTRIVNSGCGECGMSFDYGGGGLVKSVTYANGGNDLIVHDARGNVLSKKLRVNTPFERHFITTYNPKFHLPEEEKVGSICNPTDTSKISHSYDASGNLLSVTRTGWSSIDSSFTSTTNYTYNSTGQVTRIEGPLIGLEDTTTFEYYSNGDLLRRIIPNGDETEYGQRNPMGNRTTVSGRYGDTTMFYYDSRNRVKSIIQHLGRSDSAVTSYDYNFEGKFTKVIFPEGNHIRYVYGKNNLVTGIFDSLNNQIYYKYDSYSRLRKESKVNSVGDTTKKEEYAYDSRGNRTKIINPDNSFTEYFYDPSGNIGSVLDASGNRTTYSYDTFNRIDTIWKFIGTDSFFIYQVYDLDGNLSKVIDPDSNVFSYGYDDRGLRVMDSSSISAEKYFWSDAGDLKAQVNRAGDTSLFLYDKMNRLTDIIYPSDPSQNIQYIYDNVAHIYGAGRLHKEISPETTTEYQYDSYGRVFEEKRTIFGNIHVTKYTYDRNGDIKWMYRPSGVSVQYSFDEARRVNKVEWRKGPTWKTLADSIEYAPFGGIVSMVYGNGIDKRTSYDQRYRTESIFQADVTLGGADTSDFIMHWAYEYDSTSNIKAISDSLYPNESRSFGYDELNRLTSASSNDFAPAGNLTYSYYNNGNRKARIQGTNTVDYSYSDNKLSTLSGAESFTFGYDSLGQNTSDSSINGIRTFQYDFLGRMVSINNGDSGRYAYDSHSLRVKKEVGPDKRAFTYSQSGQLHTEVDDSAEWIADYVYLNGSLLAKIVPIEPTPFPDPDIETLLGGGSTQSAAGPGGPPSGPTEYVYYYHLDHLGTPWFMTDTFKVVRWQAEYYPFGEIYWSATSQPNDHGFPGQNKDQTSDLDYNWNRYYDPHIGRYRQADPIGLGGGINLYSYVASNPITRTDRSGLILESIFDDPSKRSENKEKAKPFCEFLEYVRGRSLITLSHENGPMEIEGEMLTASGPRSEFRFVQDPANPSQVIDMKHFLVVGQSQSEAMGFGLEIAQFFMGYYASVFHAQDMFSNHLGFQFFRDYYDDSNPSGDIYDSMRRYFLDREGKGEGATCGSCK